MAEPVTGEGGELIDRLLEIVDDSAPEAPEGFWYNLGAALVVYIGGPPAGVYVDTGRDLPPDSIGARHRAERPNVDRAGWFRLIRTQMERLASAGLLEHILIRGLRDELTHWLNAMADTGPGDENRAWLREHILKASDDPAQIAEFRARRSESEPALEAMTDDEVAQVMRGEASSPMLDPIDEDHALSRWVDVERWSRRCDELLSDEVLHEWFDRFLKRL